MKLKKSLAIVAGLILVTAMGITGCGKDGNKAKDSDALTVLVSRDIKPSECDTIADVDEDFRLFEMVYDPLVRYGKDGEIQPALAESWDISDNGKEYTFHLRKDVKFSDGSDFNADTVLFNAKRWAEKKSFSANLVDVKKVDDYTVTFVFDEVAYPCLIEFSYPRPYRMLSETAVGKDGKFEKMIGTGQWMVDSFKDNEEVVLVPNPNYYGEKPKVKKVILKYVTDGQAKTMALQNGEADLCLADLPAESMKTIAKDKDLKVFDANGTLAFLILMNYDNPLLQDVKVRQALNYGIDKEALVKDLLNNEGTAAKGVFTPNTPYVTDKNSPGYGYDVEKAKALLKEAGYTDKDGDGILEKDGKKLSFNLVYQTEEYATWKALSEFLQSEYAKIGVEIKLEQMESSAYYDAIWKTRKYDLVLYRTYEDSWNPHGFISGMFRKVGDDKPVAWYDEKLSGNIDTVLQTIDEKARMAKYDEIFSQLNDDALTVPLYYPGRVYVYNKDRVKNIEDAPTSYEGINWSKVELVK